VLIDATNPFSQYSPQLVLADLEEKSASEVVAALGLKTVNVVRRPELIPELEAIGGDLVVVDGDGAIEKFGQPSAMIARSSPSTAFRARAAH
jgi:hypothetical protein